MNRIQQLFTTKQHGILSVYFTAGYPQLNDTTLILSELQAQGVDMVEIGIPFSDPMADGPVIQEASNLALKNGMTLRLLFEQLQPIRPTIQIPVLLMGYLNPIMQFGMEEFCRTAQSVGVDGVIIPDLPFADYIKDYKPLADKYSIKVILLITPETSEERIRLFDEHISGFIYMVSSASTTGVQADFDEQKKDYFRRIHDMSLRNPRLVGFGISNKVTFDAANEYASGAIVGSKFVQLLKENTPKEAVKLLLDAIKK
ncbi:tryptophan synthase alpha chain [Bacteroidia bacterium]|nr:tryptophan synthase alpha chain [Bacteroidia bacterium]